MIVEKSVIEKRELKVNMSKTMVRVNRNDGERVISRTDTCWMCDKSENNLGIVYRMSELGA